MMKKLLMLPNLDKRPKHKPKRKIKVNSFATAMLEKAEENGYQGPQPIDKKENCDNNDYEFYDDLFELLAGLTADMNDHTSSNLPLHLVNKKDDSHQPSSSSN